MNRPVPPGNSDHRAGHPRWQSRLAGAPAGAIRLVLGIAAAARLGTLAPGCATFGRRSRQRCRLNVWPKPLCGRRGRKLHRKEESPPRQLPGGPVGRRGGCYWLIR